MGYTSSLFDQMEAVKRRLQSPLAPPPDAFRLPQQGVAPPQAAPMSAPLLVPPPEGPALPIADDAHAHKKGIKGGLLHLLGADRMAPELAALLTPEQREQVKPGVVGSLWSAINYGKGPQTVMQERAQNVLKLTDTKSARDTQARRVALMQKWTPIVLAARTPEERFEAQAGYASELATIAGPESLGTVPNFLNAIKPDEPKSWAPQHETWSTERGVLNGQPRTILVSNTGRAKDMAGNPIDPKTLATFEPWAAPPAPIQPSYTLPPSVVGPTGKPMVLNTKTGKMEEVQDANVKPPQAARGRAIAEVLPTITSTVNRLRKFTPADIKKLSATGVNAASIANKTADSYGGMIGAAIANATVVSAPDRAYAQMVRAIGDAVARANEVGILTNQDIMRYESQVSFVSGDDEGMKRQKVNNAIAWADWLQRNKSALVPGGKPGKMPGESDAEYQQRTGGQLKSGGRNPWR